MGQILKVEQPTRCIYVAENTTNDIVGFAHAGPEHESNETYLGELYAIYLLEQHGLVASSSRLWPKACWTAGYAQCCYGCWRTTTLRAGSTSQSAAN